MHLKKADIRTDRSLCRQIKALYRLSFPKEERIPWWLLRLNSLRGGISLTAWLDGDQFCGFTSSRPTVLGDTGLSALLLSHRRRHRGYFALGWVVPPPSPCSPKQRHFWTDFSRNLHNHVYNPLSSCFELLELHMNQSA